MTELTEKEMIDFIMNAELPEDVINYDGRPFGVINGKIIWNVRFLMKHREGVIEGKLIPLRNLYIWFKIEEDLYRKLI